MPDTPWEVVALEGLGRGGTTTVHISDWHLPWLLGGCTKLPVWMLLRIDT